MKKLLVGMTTALMMIGSTSVFANTNDNYVDTNLQNEDIATVTPRAHQFVANADLNVRATASNTGTIVGWLSKGDVVWYDPEGINTIYWTKIYGTNSKGTYVNGYVSSSYITNIS